MKREIDFNVKNNIIADIDIEFKRATSLYPKFNSRHEGYAILLEELDELWVEVKKHHQKDLSAKILMRKEAVQCAAMCMRFIYDCCDEPNQSENW